MHTRNIIFKYCRQTALLLMALGWCMPSHAEQAFKIFSLQHRFAEELLPSIRPMVGENGTATAMQNNLIIRTSSENMREIEQIISTLDQARENFTIRIQRQNLTKSAQNSAQIHVQKRIGNVTISNQAPNQHQRDGVGVAIHSNQHQVSQNSSHFLRVLDGESAFITVGQAIPYTQTWIMLTQRYLQRAQTTSWVSINTGFAVRPRSIGNQVELAITPRFSQLNQNGYIDFETLTTTIRVNRGEWVDLAQVLQQQDDVSRQILGAQNGNESKNNRLAVQVE